MSGPHALRVVVIAIVLSTAGLFSTSAHAARGYYLQAGIGANDQRTIQSVHSVLMLGSARRYSGEIGMFVTDNAALGIQLNFQNNDASERRIYWPDQKIYRRKVNTNIYEATVRASVWIPRQTGLVLGSGAGIGHFNNDNGISSPQRSATAPVFELFSGFQHTFTNEFMLFCRFGYAYRDFGIVEAKYGHTSDNPIDLDLSGWFFEVGLGGHTRRGWSPAR